MYVYRKVAAATKAAGEESAEPPKEGVKKRYARKVVRGISDCAVPTVCGIVGSGLGAAAASSVAGSMAGGFVGSGIGVLVAALLGGGLSDQEESGQTTTQKGGKTGR